MIYNIMYNIIITLTNIISVGLPMYLIEKFAYGKHETSFNDEKIGYKNAEVVK